MTPTTAHPAPSTTAQRIKADLKNWRSLVRPYQKPNNALARQQALTTFIPYFALWAVAVTVARTSLLLACLVAAVNAVFVIRIFIIQHDCGHQSFTTDRRWNGYLGRLASVLTTIPHRYWIDMHNFHHAHNGQLEHRGYGDIYFMTTEEYRGKNRAGRLWYRIFRSLPVQLVVAPLLYLLISVRIPLPRLKNWRDIRWTHLTDNLLIGAALLLAVVLIGWTVFLPLYLTTMSVFVLISYWFFYVQHHHEENYNASRGEGNWDHLLASIQGSTYYKLPGVVNWMTGNIGFHHLHHLNSAIPNYHLPLAAREQPVLNRYVATIGFRESLGCIRHKLWDAGRGRMISFREYGRLYG